MAKNADDHHGGQEHSDRRPIFSHVRGQAHAHATVSRIFAAFLFLLRRLDAMRMAHCCDLLRDLAPRTRARSDDEERRSDD